MAFLYMGFSPEDDIQNRESITPFIDETRNRGDMDVMTGIYEIDFEFWPIEHPLEPSNEDRPVKCPMPNSSLINDGSRHEEQSSESSRKRAEQEISKKEKRVAVAAAEPSPPPPVRALRKRHHALTSSVNHAICPLRPEIFPSSICFSSSSTNNSVLDQTS